MAMITSPFDFDLGRKVRRAKGLANQSPLRIAGEALVFTVEMAIQRNEAIKEYNMQNFKPFASPTPGGPSGMGYQIPTGTIGVGSRTI